MGRRVRAMHSAGRGGPPPSLEAGAAPPRGRPLFLDIIEAGGIDRAMIEGAGQLLGEASEDVTMHRPGFNTPILDEDGLLAVDFVSQHLSTPRSHRRENKDLFAHRLTPAELRDDIKFYTALRDMLLEEAHILRDYDARLLSRRLGEQTMVGRVSRVLARLIGSDEREDLLAFLGVRPHRQPRGPDPSRLLPRSGAAVGV